MLKTQTNWVTHRGRLIRLALLFLLTAVTLLILCSLTLGLSWLVRAIAPLSVVFFVLGLLSMLAGVVTAMIELSGALLPVELEARFVSETVKASLAPAKRGTSPSLSGLREREPV
jgi:hypothetical protein